jgi:hypothetical protein
MTKSILFDMKICYKIDCFCRKCCQYLRQNDTKKVTESRSVPRSAISRFP